MKGELIAKEQGEEVLEFISKHANVQSETTRVVKTIDVFNIKAIEDAKVNAFVNLQKINDIRGINDFLKEINSKLPENGIFMGCVETNLQRQKRMLNKYPFIIARIYFLFDFVFKRMFPKLYFTRKLYFFVTAGRSRVLPKAEALGKLVFCGFKISEVQEIKNLTYFVCAKTNKPIPDK